MTFSMQSSFAASGDDDLVRLMERVNAAVPNSWPPPTATNLLTAYRRAANILRIEDAKDGPHLADDLHLEFRARPKPMISEMP